MKKNWKRRLLRSIALVLLLITTSLWPETRAEGNGLTIHFLDVGQADAAIVLCDDEVLMIDGGKPIGQAKIESVEYVGLPVEQRLAAGFEFEEVESVAGVEPEVETPQSGRAVGGVHEVVEGFLEGVGLQKFLREAEHDVHSGAILIGKALAMGEQQPSGALEVRVNPKFCVNSK